MKRCQQLVVNAAEAAVAHDENVIPRTGGLGNLFNQVIKLAFLLAKLAEKGLHYSPEADRVSLLRRAYLDLIAAR